MNFHFNVPSDNEARLQNFPITLDTPNMPTSNTTPTPTPVLGRIEMTHLELLSHAKDIAHMGNRTFAEVLAMMTATIAERNAAADAASSNA
jgi:hypothetical protein